MSIVRGRSVGVMLAACALALALCGVTWAADACCSKAAKPTAALQVAQAVSEQPDQLALGDSVEGIEADLEVNGIVMQVDGTFRRVTVNLGKDRGLLREAKLAIVRHSQVIARARVTESRSMDATAAIVDVAPGRWIRIGDKVIVVENGPVSTVAQEERERKARSRLLSILAGALVAGLILSAD